MSPDPLYNFVRCYGWAFKRGAYIQGAYKRYKKWSINEVKINK